MLGHIITSITTDDDLILMPYLRVAFFGRFADLPVHKIQWQNGKQYYNIRNSIHFFMQVFYRPYSACIPIYTYGVFIYSLSNIHAFIQKLELSVTDCFVCFFRSN